jgi:hypothetical protein
MHGVTVTVTKNQTQLTQQCHTGFTVTTVTALLVIFPQSRCKLILSTSHVQENE